MAQYLTTKQLAAKPLRWHARKCLRIWFFSGGKDALAGAGDVVAGLSCAGLGFTRAALWLLYLLLLPLTLPLDAYLSRRIAKAEADDGQLRRYPG